MQSLPIGVEGGLANCSYLFLKVAYFRRLLVPAENGEERKLFTENSKVFVPFDIGEWFSINVRASKGPF
jgi:hypothetical protein